MPFLEKNGNRIYYECWRRNAAEVEQTGPWITLVNGHTRTSSDFKVFARHLTDAGFRVMAPDHRGSGKTQWHGAFTLDDLAADVVAIWDAEAIAESHVLGVSMGGMVSQKLAAAAGKRVLSLTLVSTAASERWIQRSEDSWIASMERVEEKLRRFFSPDFLARNPLLLAAMAKQTLRAIESGQFIPGSEAQKAALHGASSLSDLPKIHCPVLLVHGSADQVVLPQASEELASLLPQAKVAMFEGAGHLLLAERPQELYRTVIAFIADHNHL